MFDFKPDLDPVLLLLDELDNDGDALTEATAEGDAEPRGVTLSVGDAVLVFDLLVDALIVDDAVEVLEMSGVLV